MLLITLSSLSNSCVLLIKPKYVFAATLKHRKGNRYVHERGLHYLGSEDIEPKYVFTTTL